MLKKIGQYYAKTFKKFGWIIPAVVVGVAFAIAITLEATNAFHALISAVAPLFWVLYSVGCAAVVAGVVFTVLKLKKAEVCIIDVCLACMAALAFLMIIMCCFSGSGWLLKWITAPVVLVADLVLTFFRVQNVK
jgi:hypothetical protein